ncbi:MAG: 1-acyl-sn-glycerol-3-phosphate acyltransferase [Bacteroidota bacterium]
MFFHLFFRKIYLSGLRELKSGERTILAVNHPTAFLDPAIVASFTNPTQNFLLRGDVFSSPFYRWLLRQIHTIPIFRFRDGYSSLKNNQSTFDYCYELLHQRKYLLVLAEGQTRFEKRLRPIQKGTARMAFGAYEKYDIEDIRIIPVGVNYTDAYRTRSIVMVETGEPIWLSSYMDAYRENPRKAHKQVTDEIARQLEQRVVHVEADEDELFADQCLEMQRNDLIGWTNWPATEESNELLRAEVGLARQINQLPEEDKAPWREETARYFDQLKSLRIDDLTLARPTVDDFFNLLLVLIGALPALLGFVLNYPPVGLSRRVADSTVKRKEFYTSIRFGIMLFGGLFYYLLLLPILLLIGHGAWYLLLAMPLLGICYVRWRERYQRWSYCRRYKQLPAVVRSGLQETRSALVQRLKTLANASA